ncbi:hypothetical protein [Streptomyces sp. NPDC055036]
MEQRFCSDDYFHGTSMVPATWEMVEHVVSEKITFYACDKCAESLVRNKRIRVNKVKHIRGRFVFGTPFEVENRDAECHVRLIEGAEVTESTALSMCDAMREAEFMLRLYADDWNTRTRALAQLRMSGYTAANGVNIRICAMAMA